MSSRCRSYYPVRSQQYVPVFTPLVCPDPVNTDPKRGEAYCKPALCRSEPLSHSEYLKKLVQNNGSAVSSGTLLKQGEGVYATTLWTGTNGQCLRQIPAPPATVKDAGFYTDTKGAYTSRGIRSTYDSVNTNDESTTMRRRGQAIAAGQGCTICAVTGFSGPNSTCACTG